MIERVLGEGGMGVVYAARHVRLDRPVAIKVIGSELTIGYVDRTGDRVWRGIVAGTVFALAAGALITAAVVAPMDERNSPFGEDTGGWVVGLVVGGLVGLAVGGTLSIALVGAEDRGSVQVSPR